MKKKRIVIGSRGSLLALAQSEMTKKLLLEKNPNLEIEIKTIVTSGDKDLVSNWNNSDKSLKSFFTKEIEQELIDKKIDIAVHSMKDMPVVSPSGLVLGAVPDREDNRDVFISLTGKKLEELPLGAVVGTSSLRRTMALKELRADLEIKQLRGNIHTRLRKLEEGQYDGIILAAAGLIRVGLKDKITEFLDYEKMMPAPAQGALYIQCREKDLEIEKLLKTIHNFQVEAVVKIEREFSKIFDGGCHTPMGCSGEIVGNSIVLRGIYCENGKMYKGEVRENIELGVEIAEKLAKVIKEQIDE